MPPGTRTPNLRVTDELMPLQAAQGLATGSYLLSTACASRRETHEFRCVACLLDEHLAVDSDRTEVDLDAQPPSAWDWRVANDADGPEPLLALLHQQIVPRVRAALRAQQEGAEGAT